MIQQNLLLKLLILDYATSNKAEANITWSVSDSNLQTCILYNGTANKTVACGSNLEYLNFTFGTYNFILWVNDSIGNSNYSKATYNYSIWELSEDYESTVTEGNYETFEINVSLNPGRTITTAYFIYNNTNKGVGTVTSIAGSNYSISKSITIPQVTGNTNNDFYWNITLDNNVIVNTSSNTQSVLNIDLGNCSDYSNLILNLTLRDEEDQTLINDENTIIDIYLTLKDTLTESLFSNTSLQFKNNTNAQVCISNETLNNSEYRLDVIIRYKGDTHDVEYYHIQNSTLNSSSLTTPKDITLYDLSSSNSEEFLITFKDEDFSLVEDALIDITRLYVDEGIFKTVEIPKTDSNGQTVAHLVENDIIYTFIIKKEGKILSTISNVIAVCQDQTIGDCDINLQTSVTGTEIYDWETFQNLDLSLTFDEDNRKIIATFSTQDGTVSNIQLNATEFTGLFNNTICHPSISSSSGTLTCNIPVSYGNTTIIAEVFLDGELIKSSTYTIKKDASEIFGSAGILMLAIMFLSLAFLLIGSKEGIIIGGLVGLIMAGLLNIYEGGNIIGFGSTIIWLIVGSGIIIWRISKER